MQAYLTPGKKIAVIAAVIVYIGYNLSQIGADGDFVNYVNNWLALPLGIGVSALAWYVWRQTISNKGEHIIWLGLAIGWSLWTIAELWWAVVAATSGEVPYPSGADIFWLVGYAPMFYALGRRLRSLPRTSSSAQRVLLGLVLLVVLGVVFGLVLWPIILESDLSVFLESLITLLYPIATAVMLVLALQIMFAYQQ